MLVFDVQRGIYDDAGIEHIEFRARLTAAQADALVANYDPASATSPPAADCRAVARPIAEAVAALDRP
jgi:hypothetical protein